MEINNPLELSVIHHNFLIKQVVLLVLDVHACIAKDPQHFRQLVVYLVDKFRMDNSLLEK